MKILVLNCGSSSLKFSLIELPNYRVITSGNLERVGTPEAFIKFTTPSGDKYQKDEIVNNHTDGVRIILHHLTDPKHNLIKSFDEIGAVGHRLVHGGEDFASSVLINDSIIAQLEKCIPLAPLHNPANIMGINAAKEVLPSVPHIGVFDTAFHQTMPAKAFVYGLPYMFYEKYRIRRYGFHGTSHSYVSQEAAKLVGLDYNKVKIITAHIGSGASIAAIDCGKSVDTSMGFTPNEGVLMGTRAGDIDFGIIEFILRKKDFSSEDITEFVRNPESKGEASQLTIDDLSLILNKHSGVYGVSGIGSSDMRDIDEKIKEGHYRSKLASDMLIYRVKKYIGAYVAALEGVDILVFTAGVGENSPYVRSEVCRGLEFMGIKIDESVNTGLRGKSAIISTSDSKVKVVVIPTDEEYMIAKDTYEIASAQLRLP